MVSGLAGLAVDSPAGLRLADTTPLIAAGGAWVTRPAVGARADVAAGSSGSSGDSGGDGDDGASALSVSAKLLRAGGSVLQV